MDVPGSGPVVRGGREAGELETKIDTLTRWGSSCSWHELGSSCSWL